MSFFKNLWSDLIEKRLWPVALVLLVALVAVPVFLGGGSENGVAVAALGPSGATGAMGAAAQVSLDAPGATRRDREGKLRDPFKQRQVKVSGPTGPTGPGGAGGPSTPAPGGTGGEQTAPSGKGGSSSPTSPTPPVDTTPKTTPAVPKAPSLTTFVSDLRFGRAGDTPPRKTVGRLTPLPTVAQPFFVYLGVLSDRKTAVFLLSSDVKATGRGTCQPDETICETIELRAGDTEQLAVTGADGTVTDYSLSVLDVRRSDAAASASGAESTTKTTQAKAKGKTATKGAPSAEDLGTDRYTYDDDTGLLRRVRSSRATKLGAHLPGASGTSAVDRATPDAGHPAALPARGLWGMPEFAPLH